jgi:FkbM family methyltransferase
MDSEKQSILKTNQNTESNINYDKLNLKSSKKLFYFIIIMILTLKFTIVYINRERFIISKNGKKIKTIKTKKPNINKIESEVLDFEEFTQDIYEKYQKFQKDFCRYFDQISVKKYDKKLRISEVDFLTKKFYMVVYKSEDAVSNTITYSKFWEDTETKNLLKVLYHYSTKNNLKAQDIFVLDIGSNIGWYTFFLGKFGYNVISFEPSDINNYILKRNYCLNRELNITLVKRGLYTDEKECDFYISKGNIGDGWIFCDNNTNIPKHLVKTGQTRLTKLSNYLNFLSNKNLALIKIDVEGCESKVFEGGVEILSKYHIPYIFLEFSPQSLIDHGSNPREFLQIFEKNGYKFLSSDFLDRNYLTIDYIIQNTGNFMNLYIVHSNMIS